MNTIDFEKYNLHGEEKLVMAAVAGLYAMQIRGESPQCDFQSLASRKNSGEVMINASVAKEIIRATLGTLNGILKGWFCPQTTRIAL